MNSAVRTILKPNPLFRNPGMIGLCFLLTVAGTVPGKDADPLVSRVLTTEAGLNQDWQIRLPIQIKAKEKLDRLFVFDPYLLILTDQNYLFCRNRMDGSYRFEMQIAEKGLPVVNPLYIENRVFFIIGNQLKVLDPSSGVIVQKADLTEAGQNRSACIARNDRFLYVIGIDRRIHAFQIQEDGGYVRLFTASADDDSIITSVLATSEAVFFATLTGNVVAMEPDRPAKVWQYNTSGAVTASLVLEGDSIYAGGQDTKLYQISAQTGKLLWETPFFAGDKIREIPELGKTTLYLNAGINGLYGISKQTGREIWNLPQGESVLCESGDRAYLYSRPGVLTVMNNKTGKEEYSLNFAGVTRYAVNMQDARMYVADTQGRVACISVP